MSEPFLVATRRMKQALKRDTPTTSDDIARIVHVGRATADKLRRLAAAVEAERVPLAVPAHLERVERVGQFAALAALVEGDAGARAALLSLLKLSPTHWAEAVAHAAGAVPPDGRRRLFAAEVAGMRVGLLFDAQLGTLLAEEGPSGLVYPDGSEVPVRAADPWLSGMLPSLKAHALRAWRLPGHPGWGIYGRDDGDAAPPAVAARGSIQGIPNSAPASVQAAGTAQDAGAAAAAAATAATTAATAAAVTAATAEAATIEAAANAAIAGMISPRPSQQLQRLPPGLAAAADGGPKRLRSRTAEVGASAMAEARSRLLQLRRDSAAAAPADDGAAAPWEVSAEEGAAECDRQALMDMFKRWQEGSLTLAAGVDPGQLGQDQAQPQAQAQAQQQPAYQPQQRTQQEHAAPGGLAFVPLGAVAPHHQPGLAPADVEALLSLGEGRAGVPQPQSAPVHAVAALGALRAEWRSLSVPSGFDAAAAAEGAAEVAPWLVGDFGGGSGEADTLCRGLRVMSFEARK